MASYAEERLAAYRANSKSIRARSSQMERNVAKYLLGKRVPYSGAGAAKGDCEVETDKIGRIFIECKYSASVHASQGPRIRIDFRWFDKIDRDAQIMKARFGALVFRYHDVRLSNYVIISTDVLEKYDTIDRISGATIINSGDKSGISLQKRMIDVAFATHSGGFNVAILECNRGRFAIITLEAFKELIHGSTDII